MRDQTPAPFAAQPVFIPSTRARLASLIGLAALAASTPAGAGKSGKKKKCRKCKDQVDQCEGTVSAFCAEVMIEGCQDALAPCCESFKTCKAREAYDCVFAALQELIQG